MKMFSLKRKAFVVAFVDNRRDFEKLHLWRHIFHVVAAVPGPAAAQDSDPRAIPDPQLHLPDWTERQGAKRHTDGAAGYTGECTHTQSMI